MNMAYKYVNGTAVISVNDWMDAGLTYDQYRADSKHGMLNIVSRGINGNTLIDVQSIRRLDRREAIEAAFGKLDKLDNPEFSIYRAEISMEARTFYINYRKDDGTPLDQQLIAQYTNRASLLDVLKRGMERQIMARAKAGAQFRKGEWYRMAMEWYNAKLEQFPCPRITNVRSFERVFKAYCLDGFKSLISEKIGNDNSRVVSVQMGNLLLALYRMNGKPFVSEVYELYTDFVAGNKEIYDKESGECFRPEDFRHDGRRLNISEATCRRYLKGVVGNTAIYADRNGNFDYANAMRPKHSRHLGDYSVSKVSMDDVALSRKCTRGWVYKYIAVDVVSGYYFRPAYICGKPTEATVLYTFRNMFRELMQLGLPMPGEIEVEHHLMNNVEWLNEVFPFVRFCQSPTEKRAEHNIKALKYGAAHAAGHTRGRWYAKSEAFRSVRTKVNGDMVEPEYDYEVIVADDLSDIEAHNSMLHPNQKKYPGMTRRDVLLKCANPNLRSIEPWYLFRYIGDVTNTSIRNNNYVRCRCQEFELEDFASLDRLESNNRKVAACYLPNEEGNVDKVYLYQGETYIGAAVNREQFRYNECAVERTEEDENRMLHQYKRLAKFDAKIRQKRSEIPHVGVSSAAISAIEDVPTRIVDVPEPVFGAQPRGYEEDEFTASRALEDL